MSRRKDEGGEEKVSYLGLLSLIFLILASYGAYTAYTYIAGYPGTTRGTFFAGIQALAVSTFLLLIILVYKAAVKK